MSKYDSGSTNKNQVEALRYASLGYKVYPVWSIGDDGKCRCGGMNDCRPAKHPYGKLVPHGEKQATADADTIRHWFKGAGVNIGISIGGFCVVDVDKRNGGMETLANWERQFGAMPKTPAVQSGGGGRHYYFQPLPFRCKQKEQLGCGAELLTSGCLIAPPSNHELGGRYEWLVPLETPLAEMPSWLMDFVLKQNTQGNGSWSRSDHEQATPVQATAQPFNPMRGVVARGETFADLGRIGSGERNDAVNRTIGSMLGNGFTPEEILADGSQWAERQEPP
jgi:hypothetical protein